MSTWTKRTRRLLAIAILPALLLISGSQAIHADQTSQWPTAWTKFRLNQDNNAVWSDGVSPAVKWKTHVDATIIGDASVVNNVVYVGTEEQKVLAFNATTGQQLWSTAVDNRIRDQVIVADGKLFVGTGNRNFKRDYIDENDSPVLIRGQGQNSIYGLDAANGNILWKFDTVGENMPTMLYKDGMLYAVGGDRHFYALNATTGQLYWKLFLGSYISVASLNINGDLLYTGGADPNVFFAIDIKKQAIAWATDTSSFEVGGIDDCSAAYSDSLLFTDSVTRINDDGTYGGHGIYAIDANSGQHIWSFDEGDGAMIENNKCGVPVVYNGVVYAGSPVTRSMYALDAKTGKLLWKLPNTGVIKAPPVLYDNVIYFVNVDGLLFVANAQNGNIMNVKLLGGKLNTQGPMIINNTLYIGTQKGDMFAIPTSELK